jgi:hypothetical protein
MPLVLLDVDESVIAWVDAEVSRRKLLRAAAAPVRFKAALTEAEIHEGRMIGWDGGAGPSKEGMARANEYFARLKAEKRAAWVAARPCAPRASRVGVLLEAIALGVPELVRRSKAEAGAPLRKESVQGVAQREAAALRSSGVPPKRRGQGQRAKAAGQ